jgi:hypothetical protein
MAAQDFKLHHGLMPNALKASTPIEALAGVVERVTFRNEENGFCVLRVKARGLRDLITVLGHAAMITSSKAFSVHLVSPYATSTSSCSRIVPISDASSLSSIRTVTSSIFGGMVRQHLAGENGDELAIMSGFGFGARIDDFTARKHPREKRWGASIALSHPAVAGTDRLFEIINPARRVVTSAQASGDLRLASRTFGGGDDREALHWLIRPVYPRLGSMHWVFGLALKVGRRRRPGLRMTPKNHTPRTSAHSPNGRAPPEYSRQLCFSNPIPLPSSPALQPPLHARRQSVEAGKSSQPAGLWAHPLHPVPPAHWRSHARQCGSGLFVAPTIAQSNLELDVYPRSPTL